MMYSIRMTCRGMMANSGEKYYEAAAHHMNYGFTALTKTRIKTPQYNHNHST